MIKITGKSNLIGELRRRGSGPRSYRATVEYTASYAALIHEDLAMNHPNGGQAKFLETVFRTRQREAGRILEKIMKRKNGTLKEAVLETAKFFRIESQKLVPVKTGKLRDSAIESVRS
jgi:hypothetical protein